MASDFEKPDKVHTLYRHEIPQKMWPLPVRDLFSVGVTTAEKLEKARIRTVGDLANTPLDRVQRLVGIKMGKQIHDYANGIDDSPVLAAPEEAKGYSISTTLEEGRGDHGTGPQGAPGADRQRYRPDAVRRRQSLLCCCIHPLQ